MSRSEGDRKKRNHDIVDQVVKGMKFAKPSKPTDTELLLGKTEILTKHVLKSIRPILQAGGAIKDHDKLGLQGIIYRYLLEGFSSEYSKEELIQLCCLLLGIRIMQQVEDDPWGKGVSDPLAPNQNDNLLGGS